MGESASDPCGQNNTAHTGGDSTDTHITHPMIETRHPHVNLPSAIVHMGPRVHSEENGRLLDDPGGGYLPSAVRGVLREETPRRHAGSHRQTRKNEQHQESKEEREAKDFHVTNHRACKKCGAEKENKKRRNENPEQTRADQSGTRAWKGSKPETTYQALHHTPASQNGSHPIHQMSSSRI
jgi:hypothetical protein